MRENATLLLTHGNMKCYADFVPEKTEYRIITRVRDPWGPSDLARATGHSRSTVHGALELYRPVSQKTLRQLAHALGLEFEEFERRRQAGLYKGVAMSKSDRTMWRRDPDKVIRCRVCGKPQPRWINHILTHERNHKRISTNRHQWTGEVETL